VRPGLFWCFPIDLSGRHKYYLHGISGQAQLLVHRYTQVASIKTCTVRKSLRPNEAEGFQYHLSVYCTGL